MLATTTPGRRASPSVEGRLNTVTKLVHHKARAGSSEGGNAHARLEWHQEAASQEVGLLRRPWWRWSRWRGWSAGRRVRQQRLGLGRHGRLRLQWHRSSQRWGVQRGNGLGHQHQPGDDPGRRQRADLYLFEKDQPNQSACAGACAAAWPVDQSAAPKAGSGVTASMLGTIKRSDDTTQVTYNKHPLYYYSGDSQPGQHNGQAINAFGAACSLARWRCRQRRHHRHHAHGGYGGYGG